MATEMEQSTSVLQTKGSAWDSVWASNFRIKQQKKAEGYIGRNDISMTIKMKSIFQIL